MDFSGGLTGLGLSLSSLKSGSETSIFIEAAFSDLLSSIFYVVVLITDKGSILIALSWLSIFTGSYLIKLYGWKAKG